RVGQLLRPPGPDRPRRAHVPPAQRAAPGRGRGRGPLPDGPARPVVGVGAVIVHDGRVVLIKRGKPPLYGRWVVPGGTVELGETLEAAIVREVEEETGLVVTPREVLTVFDRIEKDGEPVAYHFVVVDYLCDYLS